MANCEKTLLFQDFLFVMKLYPSESLEVDIRHLQKSTEVDKDPKWLNLRKIALPLRSQRLPNKKSATKSDSSESDKITDPILLFENVEDSSSGIVRPTLVFYPGNQPKTQCFAYIIILIQEKVNNDQDTTELQWILKPIKKIKTSIDSSSGNISFVDQFSFLHTRNSEVLFCKDINKEHSCLLSNDTSDMSIGTIIYVTSKTINGKSFVIGVYSVKNESDISDDAEVQYKLFTLKKSKLNDNDSIFESLDSSLFVSEDYASCILSIYIHNLECSSQYVSDVFVILNHGYLIEFLNGQLLLSLSLVSVFRDLDLLGCDTIFSSVKIKGVIESNKDKKMLILQYMDVCIAIDVNSEKVSQHWKDVELVLIGDVLCKGYDQLLLIFQSLETDRELIHWYLTDFSTVYIDYSHDEPNDHLSTEDVSSSATARNALQQQLSRMNLSVEHAERKLREKDEFLERNLLRLQAKASPSVHRKEDLSKNMKTPICKFSIEVQEQWYHVLDDCLVIGVHVVNQSPKPISSPSLSIICLQSSAILKSSSKQHHESIISTDHSSASTSRDFDNKLLKKIKLSNQNSQSLNGVLSPKDETIVTGCIELKQLPIVSKKQITLSVCLHYCPVKHQESIVWPSQAFSLHNCCRIELNFKDLMDNSFTELILTDEMLTETLGTGNQMYKGLLCLNTIQKCYYLTLKRNFGYINLINDWLKKIPGLVYKESINCYIYTLCGVLYLTRLEVTLLPDFINVSAKIYAREEKQYQLFMRFLSNYLPENVIFQQTSPNCNSELIQKFLASASEEIKTGQELSNLFNKPMQTEGIFEVDFKNQENVFKFHAAFENEKKVLCSTGNVQICSDDMEAVQKELRKREDSTDSIIAKISPDNTNKIL